MLPKLLTVAWIASSTCALTLTDHRKRALWCKPKYGSLDWPSAADERLPLHQLAYYLITDEEEPDTDKSYDISQVIMREHIFSLLIEFLEQHQDWKWREVKFISTMFPITAWLVSFSLRLISHYW